MSAQEQIQAAEVLSLSFENYPGYPTRLIHNGMQINLEVLLILKLVNLIKLILKHNEFNFQKNKISNQLNS